VTKISAVLAQTEPEQDITTRFPIGTQLRILPNHACATGAQFPEYHAVATTQGGEPEAGAT
jgi:D-serine deaminase-like pyridoxal phosphate-dependent protein